jgi:prepilin-type N-terminal cleavage/methylation domain-containing protein
MSAAMGRLRQEQTGFTLTELLVGITIFVVLLGAVLATFNQFEVTNRLANDRNDSQDRARQQLDRLARELRNLASPTVEQPQAVDKANAYDIVFQAVDPAAPPPGSQNAANVRRVRYCLNTDNPANEVLWTQWQTWTTKDPPNPAPATAECPDPAWGPTNRRQVTANVTNQINGQARPLFTFNSAVPTEINRIHVDLFIDLTPAGNPTETRLNTGVFLRNQNRRPTAAFEATRNGPDESKRVLLNASASEDPEGAPLTYRWYDVTGGAAPNDATNLIGNEITCDCAALGSGSRSILLRVSDPPGLKTERTEEVTAP